MTLRAAAQQFTSIAAVRNAENCGCVNADDPTDDELDEMIDQASDVLVWFTNGAYFGRSTVTIRPCRAGCWADCACGCGLDGVPIRGIAPEITSVKIDGDTLSASLYTIHESRSGFSLVRVSNDDTRPPAWPSWQELWKPDTADGTFSITLEHGYHLDYLASRAALELVCMFAKADQVKKNQLPRGTVAANYNSTSVSLEERRLTAQGAIDSKASGEAVTQFLAVYGNATRSAVWAPELDEGWTTHIFRRDQGS